MRKSGKNARIMNYIVQKITTKLQKIRFFPPPDFWYDLSQQKRQEGFYYEEKTCTVTGMYHGVKPDSMWRCTNLQQLRQTTAAATEAAAESSEESKADEKTEAAGGDMDALIEAAKAEGELTVYGSCEEEYLSAACQNFEKLYGIKTKYQRLSTSEVYTKISEEAGKPSADVWFGGTTDPYNEAVAAGLLEPYDAINAIEPDR